MKFKTTRKAVAAMFPRCFRAGYCELSALLHYVEPVAYNAGVYGWNWDLYNVGGVAICTGYRAMTGANIPGGLADEYEKKARAILDDYKKPYEERKTAVSSLLDEFTGKLLEV